MKWLEMREGGPADRTRYPASMLSCNDVSFSYGAKPLLRDVNLQIPAGTLAALVGRNGTGKSTLLRLLAGLLSPRSGSIRVAGLDPHLAGPGLRRRLGVLPETLALLEEMSLEEQLLLTGRLYGLSEGVCQARLKELAGFLEFRTFLWHRARACSQGTRKKLALAMALLPDPEVLLLDEPFETMDPAAAQRIESLLKALATCGRTVLFSAHDLALVLRLNCGVWLLTPGGQVELRSMEGLDPRAFQLAERQPELPSWLG
jgi:ABC-2 type transport system ATP-binding protein